VDLFHPNESIKKVAEYCTVSGYVGEAFHDMTIANGMFKVNVGRILVPECPLFVAVEEDIPPQLHSFECEAGMTL
jgi:hypothetical protein